MVKFEYPQWFIDQLVLDSDKELARDNKLPYKKKVLFYCDKCGKNYKEVLVYNIVCKKTGEKIRNVICDCCKRPYPQWFIDDLVDEEDKEKAKKGVLSSNSKVKFRCNKGHIYTQIIHNHIHLPTGTKKEGCPICGKEIKRKKMDMYHKTLRTYPQWFIDELVNEEDKEKARKGDLYKKAKVLFRCNKNHTYTQCVQKHITTSLERNQGCPLCYKESDKKFNFHNLTGQTYSDLTVLELVNSKESLWKCRCVCGNECIVYSGNLICGHTTSCGCKRTTIYNNNRVFPEWFRDVLVNEKDKQDYDSQNLSSISTDGSKRKIELYCRNCGVIYTREVCKFINSFIDIQKGWCKKCCNNYFRSSFEDNIKDFISNLIDYTPIENSRNVIINPQTKKKLELDLYYPENKLAIEVNGSYYHATIGRKWKNYPKDKHFLKYKLCKEQGIHLISIFDVDWWYRHDKIKAILSSILTKPQIFYARNTECKPIDKSIGYDFLNQYHLDGDTRQSIYYYGLYSKDNILLSVMSFGKLRGQNTLHTKENYYELTRFATLPNIKIVGGASKLLKAFEREYHPEYLLAYSDNDYFTGNVYSLLGFSFSKYTDPDYYWYTPVGNVYLNRWQCQPKKLKEKYPDIASKYTNAIEDNVMTELGYLKVYRTGQSVWEKYTPLVFKA